MGAKEALLYAGEAYAALQAGAVADGTAAGCIAGDVRPDTAACCSGCAPPCCIHPCPPAGPPHRRCARTTAGTAASASTSGARGGTRCPRRRCWRWRSGHSSTAWAPSCCRHAARCWLAEAFGEGGCAAVLCRWCSSGASGPVRNERSAAVLAVGSLMRAVPQESARLLLPAKRRPTGPANGQQSPSAGCMSAGERAAHARRPIRRGTAQPPQRRRLLVDLAPRIHTLTPTPPCAVWRAGHAAAHEVFDGGGAGHQGAHHSAGPGAALHRRRQPAQGHHRRGAVCGALRCAAGRRQPSGRAAQPIAWLLPATLGAANGMASLRLRAAMCSRAAAGNAAASSPLPACPASRP